MTSRRVLAAQSAQSTTCKRSVHVREMVRRMLNTSGRLEWDTHVAPVLMDYLARMMEAGYNEPYRKVTLERALAVFDQMKDKENKGIQPINRPKDWNLAERRKQKNKKQRSWATRGGFIAPIIIPSTPNSELLKMMREVARTESEPGLRFKIVERGGTTIKRQVQNSNPTGQLGCQSGDCPACQGGRGRGGNCRRSNVQYEFGCNLCPEDRKHVYIGETARNLYTRGKEHTSNFVARNKESFMKNHQIEKHHGADADFSATVTGRFRDCLSRQVSEGVHIRRSQHIVLNSKTEWHQPALWRIRSEIVSD